MTSSTMMLQPAVARSRMFWAKVGSSVSAGAHPPVGVALRLDRAAECQHLVDDRLDAGGRSRHDVDRHPAIRVRLDEAEGGQRRQPGVAALVQQRHEQSRIDLVLHRALRRLDAQDRLQLRRGAGRDLERRGSQAGRQERQGEQQEEDGLRRGGGERAEGSTRNSLVHRHPLSRQDPSQTTDESDRAVNLPRLS
jgi:hypothetical protein